MYYWISALLQFIVAAAFFGLGYKMGYENGMELVTGKITGRKMFNIFGNGLEGQDDFALRGHISQLQANNEYYKQQLAIQTNEIDKLKDEIEKLKNEKIANSLEGTIINGN